MRIIMKRTFITILIVAMSILFASCDIEFPERTDYPSIESETITATVIDVSKNKWFAANAYHYEVQAQVYSEEYDISGFIESSGSGMFASVNWDICEGDKVKVIMHNLIDNESGEIIRREIIDFA